MATKKINVLGQNSKARFAYEHGVYHGKEFVRAAMASGMTLDEGVADWRIHISATLDEESVNFVADVVRDQIIKFG